MDFIISNLSWIFVDHLRSAGGLGRQSPHRQKLARLSWQHYRRYRRSIPRRVGLLAVHRSPARRWLELDGLYCRGNWRCGAISTAQPHLWPPSLSAARF